jgi:hypothetical protein
MKELLEEAQQIIEMLLEQQAMPDPGMNRLIEVWKNKWARRLAAMAPPLQGGNTVGASPTVPTNTNE